VEAQGEVGVGRQVAVGPLLSRQRLQDVALGVEREDAWKRRRRR
jgi:hypothetical protein